MALISKKKKNTILYILILILVIPFFFLFLSTPGLKGDLEQGLRIFFKQPILLKTSSRNNSILDNSKKIIYAFQNKLLSKNNFELIKISVPFDQLKILREERKKALDKKKLINPKKINVDIFYKNKKYAATARLKGDLSEHWGNIKQWSLRIKLKKKETILNMNEFSISVHSERNFPYNFLIYKTMKNYNLLTPKYYTLKVNFNGNDWGLMLAEEQFSDSFYELNQIKKAPIFKMTNENDFLIAKLAIGNFENIDDIIKWQGKFETKIYNKKKILRSSNIPKKKTNQNLASIFKSIQETLWLDDEKNLDYINKFLNIKSFAKALAIASVYGDFHGLQKTNARYYLNPYNLKVEPIHTDFSNSKIDIVFFERLPNIFQNMFELQEFRKIFLETIIDIEKNLNLVEINIEKICIPYGRICLNLFDIDQLKANINFLLKNKSNIFENLEKQIEINGSEKKFNTKNKKNIIKKKLHSRFFNDNELIVFNLTSENLSIKKIVLKCKKKCAEKILDVSYKIVPSTNKDVTIKKIKIEKNKEHYDFIEIDYYDEKNNLFIEKNRIEKAKYKRKNIFKEEKYFLYPFIKKLENNYTISKGSYVIDQPLIIPKGNNLIIDSGTILEMSQTAFIYIEDGILQLNGTKDSIIVLRSTDEKKMWKGIYVNSENSTQKFSKLNNVKIQNTTYFDGKHIQLTGGINFYKSKVLISNSQIDTSNAEDAINFIHSKFEIENVDFFKMKSDAIDSDFSDGKIKSSNFREILGDAIDTSGSKISLTNIFADEIGDKAISAGEESLLKLNNITIKNSKIGIASKDKSKVIGNYIEIKNCGLYDVAAYQKKSFYGGGYIDLKKTSTCNMSLVQEGSNIKLNNEILKSYSFDIKKIYN